MGEEDATSDEESDEEEEDNYEEDKEGKKSKYGIRCLILIISKIKKGNN